MALIIQNEAGISSYVPYERPPQALALWTAIPRGLQSFLWPTIQLDAITGTNLALLNLTAVLPPNFGYVMNDLNLSLNQDKAGRDWSVTYNLNLQNFYRAAEDESLALASNWLQSMDGIAAQDDNSRTSTLVQPWPSFPIVSSSATGVLVNISTFNNAGVAHAAGVINAYVSFWQFDLEQIRKYPINSPAPTHAR